MFLLSIHNWLIDKKDTDILLSAASNRLNITSRVGHNFSSCDLSSVIVIKENRLDSFLNGDDHFDDSIAGDRFNHQKGLFGTFLSLPRQKLMDRLNVLGINERLNHMGSTTANNTI